MPYAVYLILLINRAFKSDKTSRLPSFQGRYFGIIVLIQNEIKMLFRKCADTGAGRNIPSLCATATNEDYDKSVYNDNFIIPKYKLHALFTQIYLFYLLNV